MFDLCPSATRDDAAHTTLIISQRLQRGGGGGGGGGGERGIVVCSMLYKPAAALLRGLGDACATARCIIARNFGPIK
jgi:hypothetical protein